jgi:hypothetical protein
MTVIVSFTKVQSRYCPFCKKILFHQIGHLLDGREVASCIICDRPALRYANDQYEEVTLVS